MNSTILSIFSQTENDNFFLIAGPCAIESKQLAIDIAGHIVEITKKLDIPYIFKGSYRKANRTRLDSFSGIGDLEALTILKEIGIQYQISVTTDIHSEEEAAIAGLYCDILQIPAFLCRQTNLLIAAAQTGKPINIKKGQFLSPESMKWAVKKVWESGNDHVLLTERGTMFGYQDLIVDFRGIPIMQSFNVPVILDCTHSLQTPNQTSGVTGGQPSMIGAIAKAGVAVGVNGIFIESHPNPSKALSDGANMLPLKNLESLLEQLLGIRHSFSKEKG